MSSDRFFFGEFVLDPENRRLTRDDTAVELSSRYLDALVLLVRERGQLVSKARFLDEVWRGVPVTDEAITQCIKTLRQQLGDKAASPSFIETVPKHGYRFIAPVSHSSDDDKPVRAGGGVDARRRFLMLGTVGIVGGGMAGVFGGLIYGFIAASQAMQPGSGAISVLLVVTCITTLMATMGGAGVGFGIGASGLLLGRSWVSSVFGGAAGGLLTGAMVKLVGIDAFNVLFGNSPGDITGGAEGAVLGGVVGFGIWLASQPLRFHKTGQVLFAVALAGATGGVVITLLGGRLMVGSLVSLVREFASSRLRLDQLGQLFGESDFGQVTQVVTGGLEGALFAVSIAGAMIVAERRSCG